MAEQNGDVMNPFLKGRGIIQGSGMKVIGSSTSSGSNTSMSARLPSFRGPRDLTLSASSSAIPVKPSLMTRTRKTFSPNIPVRRGKTESVIETHPDKAPKRNRERDKKEGGRGRSRGREFIQTTGSLFGEGIAAAQKRGEMGSYGICGGGGGGGAGKACEAAFIHKPVLNLDTVNNIDKEHEDQKLKEILRDDFIDDPDDVIGRDSNGDLFPVQLPMVDTGRVFKEEDEGKDVKNMKPNVSTNLTVEGIAVKSEPVDSSDNIDNVDTSIQDLALEKTKLEDKKVSVKGGMPAKEKTPECSVAQLLAGKHEDFMFFQLPNSLPSHPPDVKQEPNITQLQNQTQQQKQTASNNLDTVTHVSHVQYVHWTQLAMFSLYSPSRCVQADVFMDLDEDEDQKSSRQYCTLSTLPEGQIGTLKVYKSGRAEMWFGQHKLAVNKGTQVGFLQDVVSVQVDEESKSGSMAVLGHIGHRLVCTPDLESLVRQRKT